MSTKYRADVLVVGAGPAGMGAAIEAARAGAKTIVVDGFSRAGGQYWIQPPSHLKARESQVKEGATHIAELKNFGVEMFSNTEVWGVLPGNRVLARGQNDESIEFYWKDAGCLYWRTRLGLSISGMDTPGGYDGRWRSAFRETLR